MSEYTPLYSGESHSHHSEDNSFSRTAAIVIIAILIIGAIIAIIVIFISRRNNNNRPQPPPGNECTKPFSELQDISGVPCCFSGGEATPLRYLSSINMTVAPAPTYYVDACSGFCENGDVNMVTMTCSTGSVVNYETCTERIKPVNCQGAAFPVAYDGIQLYYAKSATNAQCTETGACIPSPNPSSVDSGRRLSFV